MTAKKARTNTASKKGKAPRSNARTKAADNARVTRNARVARVRKALLVELKTAEYQAELPSMSPNGEWG